MRASRGLDDAFILAGLVQLSIKAALDVAKLLTMPAWLSMAIYAVGALTVVVAVLLRWRRQRVQRRLLRVQRLEQLLELPRMPRVREADPYTGPVGVSHSRYASGADPYVPRATDHDIVRALHCSEFVLVTGASKAGKSRTAFEAVQRAFPAACLVVPRQGGLEALFGPDSPLDQRSGPQVLWLDDIDRYLSGSGRLSWSMLEWLHTSRPWIIVVGTITAARRRAIYSGPRHGERPQGFGSEARHIVEAATTFHLPRDLTERERVVAKKLYPNERFQRGIGEQLVAAWEHDRLAEDGPVASPFGWALIEAAIDWRRAGMSRSAPRSALYELAGRRLHESLRNPVPTTEQLDANLVWAQEQPADSPVKALRRANNEPEDSYEPFDYLVERADGHNPDGHSGVAPRPVQRAVWDVVLRHAEPDELAAVGRSAYERDEPLIARRALERMVASDESSVATYGANSLGTLLYELGSVREAKRLFRQVIRGDQPDEAVRAMLNLGTVLCEEGSPRAGRQLLSRVAGSGYAILSSRARARLDMLERTGTTGVPRPARGSTWWRGLRDLLRGSHNSRRS